MSETINEVLAKYSKVNQEFLEAKQQISKLEQCLNQQQDQVDLLKQVNEKYGSKISGLQRLSVELTKSFSLYVEEKGVDAAQLKSVFSEALISFQSSFDTEKQIDEMKQEHIKKVESLRRSNALLKDLVQQNSVKPLASTLTQDQLSPLPKAPTTMKSARNKYKNHRKSRSFGIGENMNFNFPFRSFKPATNSPLSNVFGLSPSKKTFNKPNPITLNTNLDKPSPSKSFFDFNPLSPMKNNFKKAVSSPLAEKVECESPITESKMTKLFNSTNISLVNMSRPRRGGASKFRKGKKETELETTSLRLPELPSTDILKNESMSSFSSSSMSIQSDAPLSESPATKEEFSKEELESFDAEICDATKIDYSLLDPKYVITPSMKPADTMGESPISISTANSEFTNDYNDTFAQPSMQSVTEFSSPNSNYSSPRRQNNYFNVKPANNITHYNNYSTPSLVSQTTDTNFQKDPYDSLGLYSVRSRNGSTPNFSDNLNPVGSNGTTNSATSRKYKNFIGFEKPDAKLFGHRQRSNSNSINLRKLF